MVIIIYMTYYMFLQEKLKSINLTKLINIVLHNDKKTVIHGLLFLTIVPPAHVAFLGEAYESCRQLPL